MAVWPTETKLEYPRFLDTAPTEGLGLTVINRGAWVPAGLRERIAQFSPHSELGRIIKTILGDWHLTVEQANELLDRITASVVMETQTVIQVIRHLDSPFRIGNNWVEDYGVMSRKVITTTGVEELVDAFQSSGVSLRYYWHAIGLSSVAEAVGNTALTNEMTTLGYGAASRTSGTLTTGAAGPHVFETVGTITIDNVSSGTPMVIQ